MTGISRYEKIALGATAVFAALCLLMLAVPGDRPNGHTVTPVSGIVFPTEQENGDYPDSLLPGEKIDVNTAAAEDLQRLPGIGEKRAEDIVSRREEHGPFVSIDDLMQVPGIGAGILDGIRDYITINEE